MRRLLCMVLTGAVMIGCLCTGTGAVDESNVVSKEYETTGTAITRATGNLDWTIKANGTVVADTSFTMSAGETVRIRANYSPENASLDFGLVDSNEKFHYINVTTGSIDKTIEIPENGDYTLAIRNNSSKSVKVTGDVRYYYTITLWETVLQSPYSVDFTEEQARYQIHEDLMQHEDGKEWALSRIGICEKPDPKFCDPFEYNEIMENENVLVRYQLRANYQARRGEKTGFWDIILVHQKPIPQVPKDMRP